MKNKRFPLRVQRLHIWTDDSTWVVAFDPDDAKKAWVESVGGEWDETYEPFDRMIPDNHEFKIVCEPDDWDDFWRHRPMFARADFNDRYFKAIIAPAWAWCLNNGRGFLSSTEF